MRPTLKRTGLFATATLSVLARTGPAPAQDAAPPPSELQDVIVTGTRAEGRTALGSSVPVAVVTGEQLSERGYSDLGRALEALAPSVNYPRAATTATSADSRPVTLRGLAPDQVLVLVNGKRRHASAILNTNNAVGRGSAPVDLDLIPVAAIERIEVLQDGAAAQYGSDAIGGVVNIILKHDAGDRTLSVQGGATGQGDGANGDAAASAGFRLGEDGELTLTGEFRRQGPTNRANVDVRFGRVTYEIGDPDLQLFNFALDGAYDAGGGTAYVFGTASRKDATNAAGFRPPGYSPLYPNGFLPKVNPVVADFDLTFGYKRDIGGATVDLSHTIGYDDASFHVFDTANVSLGLQGPTSFGAGSVAYRQHVTDLAVTRPFADILAGVNVAAGLEHRAEFYDIGAGERDAYIGLGADGFAGFNPRVPVHASRNAYAGFLDIEVKPVPPLTLGAAARYDRYDDFGGEPTYKATARWEAADWIAFRASTDSGFRAPSLQQQYFSAVAGGTAAGKLVTVGTLPVSDPVALALGAGPLKAETSVSQGAGIVLTPRPDFSLTADVFRTHIDNRIVLSEQLAGPAVTAALKAAGVTSFQQVRFFTNAADTTTQGLDVTSRYTAALDERTSLRLDAGYGVFATNLDRLRGNPVLPSLPLVAQKSSLYVTSAQPRDKATFSAELKHDRATFDIDVVRYGSYVALPVLTPQTFSPKTVVDLTASLAVAPGATLTLGILDIADETPDSLRDTSLTNASTGGSFRYGEESPFDVNGRTFFARLDARF